MDQRRATADSAVAMATAGEERLSTIAMMILTVRSCVRASGWAESDGLRAAERDDWRAAETVMMARKGGAAS